jgi:hypothetical protein
MKKLITLLVVFLVSLSSCGVYQMVSYPKEIKDKGGELSRSVTATLYEVRVGEEITRKQDRTQTYLYLYKLNDDYYWKIIRSSIETQNSFFPQNLNIKIDAFKSGENEGSHAMYGVDELTGKRYNIIQIPWSKGYGYFYIVGDKDKQIVYSVGVTEITIH